MSLNEEQIERYSRHIILSEVGGNGQEKILNGKVLVVGAGGLGSPAAFYLAAAGIGTLGLIDSDVVDRTNLQRQILHFTKDLNRPKIESAKEKIEALNPGVRVRTYKERLTADNAIDIIKDFDFVLDGTDNFPSKFLISDACFFADKPYSHGGILRFQGQTLTTIPRKTACYRCVFRKAPPKGAVPSCSQAGVLGVLAGVIGSIQATEALKYLLGIGDLLTDRLLTYDALKLEFRNVNLKKQKNCPLCGEKPTITELYDEEQIACDLKNK